MKKPRLTALLSFAMIIFGLSRPARADQLPLCTIEYVQYLNEQLVIKCSERAEEFHAFGSEWTACSSRQSSETLKVFVSLAQAAFLSKKHLLFNYNVDNTCPKPNAIILVRILP